MTAPQTAEAADRIESMILLTERLTALIALDAAAFEQRRPQEAASRIEETSRLANLYRHESTRLRAAPDIVAAADPDQKSRLMRSTEAFDAVLARQGRALEAAKTVANQRSSNAGYGARGLAATPAGAATAITLNQRA